MNTEPAKVASVTTQARVFLVALILSNVAINCPASKQQMYGAYLTYCYSEFGQSNFSIEDSNRLLDECLSAGIMNGGSRSTFGRSNMRMQSDDNHKV